MCTGGVVLAAVMVLLRGVRKGIERGSRIITPLLFATLLLLIVRALTLPGAFEGLEWYILKFRIQDLTAPVALAALGQVVFSLALGGTFMVVYGSYLKPEDDLARNAAWTVTGDTAAGLLAGLAIFPAVFALGEAPGSGPGLIFITLPNVFGALPGGWIFGTLFFLSLAGVSYLSAIAAFEVLIAGLVDNTRLTRTGATWIMAGSVLLLALSPMVNMGVFVPWDLTFGSGLQTAGVFAAVLTVGWAMDRSAVLAELASEREELMSSPRWNVLYLWIRWVIPAAILCVGGWWFFTEVVGRGEAAAQERIQPRLSWEVQEVPLSASLRGLSAPDSATAWVSGTGGSYAFTRDGGERWQVGVVPGAEELDFRDVEAFSDGTVYLMSAGSGTASRIFKSRDWGRSWTLQHSNELEEGFSNGFAFWSPREGALVGDPVDGALFVLLPRDGGDTWARLQGPSLPRLLSGEYGFAASGTNIATFGPRGLAVATGGSASRVFLSPDRGGMWQMVETPMTSGSPSRGIFSIAFRGTDEAVIVGGDYQNPELPHGTAAYSRDGGRSWALARPGAGRGFRSGVAWRDGASGTIWVAVGTPGSSYSIDGGQSWVTFDSMPLNAVAFGGGVGWGAGPDGRVVRLVVR